MELTQNFYVSECYLMALALKAAAVFKKKKKNQKMELIPLLSFISE